MTSRASGTTVAPSSTTVKATSRAARQPRPVAAPVGDARTAAARRRATTTIITVPNA